jgi:hypothetical protein
MMNLSSRQRGLSLIAMLIIAIFLGIALLIGFQSIPIYSEYFGVKRITGMIADEGDSGSTDAELRRSFERRAEVEQSISTVKPTDLVIRKQGGRTEVTVEWERKIHLVGQASLLYEFKVNSSQRKR